MSKLLRKQLSETLDYLKGQIKLAQNVGIQVDSNGFLSVTVARPDIDAAGISFYKFVQTIGWLYPTDLLDIHEGSAPLLKRIDGKLTFDLDKNESVSFLIKPELLDILTGPDSAAVARLVAGETFSKETRFATNPFSYADGVLRFQGRDEPVHKFHNSGNSRKFFDVLWSHRRINKDGVEQGVGKTTSISDLYKEADIVFPGDSAAEEAVKSFKKNISTKFEGLPIKLTGTRQLQIELTI